jgi:hypothetical protein
MKMICVRVPDNQAHQFKVDLRANGETAQAVLLGVIEAYTKKSSQKRKRRLKKGARKRKGSPISEESSEAHAPESDTAAGADV